MKIKLHAFILILLITITSNIAKAQAWQKNSKVISLGFGAFFATCFNISNNCPLAFWWGDLWSLSSETLGKWYPLLPREVNCQKR